MPNGHTETLACSLADAKHVTDGYLLFHVRQTYYVLQRMLASLRLSYAMHEGTWHLHIASKLPSPCGIQLDYDCVLDLRFCSFQGVYYCIISILTHSITQGQHPDMYRATEAEKGTYYIAAQVMVS